MATQRGAAHRKAPPPDSAGPDAEPTRHDATEVPVLLAGTPPLLTPPQQEQLLQLLLRGASPWGACQQLNLSVFSIDRSLEESKDFALHLGKIYEILSRNVLAALYRAAMGGNVSAQTFWLKICPPAGWERTSQRSETDAYDELSDRELIELARAIISDLPAEGERSPDLLGSQPFPEVLPPGDPPVAR